jgi:hypothetical protein
MIYIPMFDSNLVQNVFFYHIGGSTTFFLVRRAAAPFRHTERCYRSSRSSHARASAVSTHLEAASSHAQACAGTRA